MLNQQNQFFYLIRIRFLGFRYSGWQIQPNAKTIQEMVNKTFRCIFEHEDFKTLGCSRTDSRVSAEDFAFELFTKERHKEESLLKLLNENLPSDIEALEVKEVSKEFNIISDPKVKEYNYLFSNESRTHPYCSPFMVNISDSLDIKLMQKGAALFEGEHNFQKYCYKPSLMTNFVRTIELSEIIENTKYTANFFPKKSWIYRVQGKGFLRYQVRILIGTLFELGKKKITLDDIKESLTGGDNERLGDIAPSSGLSLQEVQFLNEN